MESPQHPVIDPKRQRMLKLLWVALAIWIVLLAVGASLYAPAPEIESMPPSIDWRRGAMVLVFVGGFLGTWMWLASGASDHFRRP